MLLLNHFKSKGKRVEAKKMENGNGGGRMWKVTGEKERKKGKSKQDELK